MCRIIFTDEKIFTIDGGSRVGYIMPGDTATVIRKGRFTQGQMCWTGVTYSDDGPEVIGPYWIKGTIDTDVYAKLLSMVFKDYHHLKNKVFQQDNAPCYKCENVIPRLLLHHDMKVEDMPLFLSWWPPQSPDLSPIENWFAWVDGEKRDAAWCMMLDEMKGIINNIMGFLNPLTGMMDLHFEKRASDTLSACLLSWPGRLQACVDDVNGGWTKY